MLQDPNANWHKVEKIIFINLACLNISCKRIRPRGETRDTKPLNLSRNIVSLQVLGRCLALFTSRDQLIAQSVAGCRRISARWLVDLLGVDPRQVASLMKNEQQSQNFLLKVDSRFTFCNNFLQPIKKYLLRDKLITQGEKRETLTQNLQRNNVAQQVEGFCISCFAAFNKTCSSRGI